MTLLVDGQVVTSCLFNSVPITELQVGGVKVWPVDLPPQTLIINGPPTLGIDTNPPTLITATTAESHTITSMEVEVVLQGGAEAALVWTDLDILLTHNGTTVELLDGRWKINDPQTTATFQVTFKDSASSLVPNQGGVVGSFLPDEPLSAFNGHTTAGDWVLSIGDANFANDGDQLITYEITFTY